jgi:hypothetical protein
VHVVCGFGFGGHQGKTMDSFLQALGAGCVLMIAVVYLAEAVHLFPAMGWGMEHSAGDYTDFVSAVLGLSLFSVGYLLRALWFKP